MKVKLSAIALALIASLGSVHAQQTQQQPQAGNAQGAQSSPVPANYPTNVGQPQALPPLPEVNFDALVKEQLGLTPDQIRKLKREVDSRQKAAAAPAGPAAKPVVRVAPVSTAPGAVPPVVRFTTNFATSLVVSDSTGQPWPIENFSVGNRESFEVSRMDGVTGSALSVVPLNTYANSNLILYLRGLSTPIVVTFVAGQKETDYRVDLRVNGRGPNAQFASAGLPAATNMALASLLEGVAPSGARMLRVSNSDAQAWLTQEGNMVMRTSLQVISPAWMGSMRSSDGMSAYEFKPASSVLVLKDGLIQTLSIEGM